jgi:hypothetical protein
MDNQLTSTNVLAYMGVNAQQPPNLLQNTIDPTPANFQFPLGTQWVNYIDKSWWVLVAITPIAESYQATWLTVSGSGEIATISGNDGIHEGPVAGNFSFVTANATPKFLGTAGTETLDFGLSNLILGRSGSTITSGTANVGFGFSSLGGLTTGTSNTCMGYNSGLSLKTGIGNTAIGSNSLQNAQSVGSGTNNYNTAVGYLCMITAGQEGETASYNTGVGSNCLAGGTNFYAGSYTTALGYMAGNSYFAGSYNIFLGYNSGTAYTNPFSGMVAKSNILIGNVGMEPFSTPESNTIRIGTQGTGNSQQNLCYIAGIYGSNTSSGMPVYVDSTGALGTGGGSSTPLSITTVNTTPYVVLATDQYIDINTHSSAITIQLPNTTTVGRFITIKDQRGNSFVNNITITTVGGSVTIDGLSSQIISVNYKSINVIWTGSAYEIF